MMDESKRRADRQCNLMENHESHIWGISYSHCEGRPTMDQIFAARVLLGLEKQHPLVGWGESG